MAKMKNSNSRAGENAGKLDQSYSAAGKMAHPLETVQQFVQKLDLQLSCNSPFSLLGMHP